MVFNPDVRDLRRPLPRGYWIALPSGDDDVAVLASARRAIPGESRKAAPVAQDGNQSELIRAYDVHNSRLRNNQF
jgi:hypothetical protein